MASRARPHVRSRPSTLDELFSRIEPHDSAERAALDAIRANWRGYDDQYFSDLDRLRAREPRYASRLEFALEEASGIVLEIGPSIGAMSRRLAEKPDVILVIGCDVSAVAQRTLAAARIPKVLAGLHTPERPFELPPSLKIDTILLCEVIEHIRTEDEIAILRHFAPWLDEGTRFVISTPIGFMPDPEHVRGFSRDEFLRHVETVYGAIDRLDDDTSYSQSAAGTLSRISRYRRGGGVGAVAESAGAGGR